MICISKCKIRLAEEEQKNNSSLLAHISNLPGFDASTARFATQYSTRSSPDKSVMEIVPTAAEMMLPWRRELSYQNIGTFHPKKKQTKKQQHLLVHSVYLSICLCARDFIIFV